MKLDLTYYTEQRMSAITRIMIGSDIYKISWHQIIILL
jgi:hypothetical protein